MRLALKIEIPPDMQRGWFHQIPYENINRVMMTWLHSPERERLISLGIPFLFIGAGKYVHKNKHLVVLDIPKKYIGVARVVVDEITGSLHSLFDDVRLDYVRNSAVINEYVEKLCSHQRELNIYYINGHRNLLK